MSQRKRKYACPIASTVHQGQDGEREAVAPAPFHSLELVSVECGPSDCPVDERLELSMDFALDRPLTGAWWDVKVSALSLLSLLLLLVPCAGGGGAGVEARCCR